MLADLERFQIPISLSGGGYGPLLDFLGASSGALKARQKIVRGEASEVSETPGKVRD